MFVLRRSLNTNKEIPMAELNENNLRSIVATFKAVEERLSDPQVTADNKRLTELSRERARLAKTAELSETWLALKTQIAECDSGWQSEKDAEMKAELGRELKALKEQFNNLSEELQLELIPKDADAGKNVYLEIRAGTGGDEAGLFVRDLFRMYTRYFDSEGIRYEVQEFTETGVGGVKEAILLVLGERAYDLLHLEAGTHRVQRIPATEANGRIHTSAVTVAVIPEADEDEIKIDPGDLRIDVFRSSGSGGQHVNKTESAVRITHLPTGIVVGCQEEKSQIKNRAKAMKALMSKLVEKQRSESQEKYATEKKAQVGSGDRSEKIRTYNYPQNRVTDHRINFTAHNLDQIMEGKLGDVIGALLLAEREAKMRAGETAVAAAAT
ncbi:bacterial peptide chain release factor 1 (bRF-1) [Turneriella parva DSM 21527]|uniref:Peptide chain release factor 1 n=2 Tax=Turneriella TaxID=338321 RepID=I4B5P5_TURPD|nr:bacterial peptide chain release factor 1 (bRF-1) [Turneriella parva DSM 21527]